LTGLTRIPHRRIRVEKFQQIFFAETLRSQLYTPFMQLPDKTMAQNASGIGVLVRSDKPATVFGSIRQVNSRRSGLVVFGAQTMEEIIASSLGDRRFSMILLGIFAALTCGIIPSVAQTSSATTWPQRTVHFIVTLGANGMPTNAQATKWLSWMDGSVKVTDGVGTAATHFIIDVVGYMY
jgi:hypothetical protein